MNTLEKIQSLINAANEVTGKVDEDLTNAVKSLIDGYSKPIIEKTIIGVPPLTLTAEKEGAATYYKLAGKTAQDRTPTRDAPIEIKGVGDNTLSANDAFKVINGYLKNGTSIVAEDDNRILVYKLEPNTKYHISLEKKNSNVDDIVYSFSSKEPNIGDSVIVGHIYPSVSGSVSYSFDITTDSTNIWLCLKLCKVSITDFDLAWNSVKIVGGSYRATITLNGTTSKTIYLNKPLYGIGSDYGEVVLTGSERIDSSGSSSGELNTYYYSYRYSDLNMADIIDGG